MTGAGPSIEQPPQGRLVGKTALVTGGTSGIGLAMAHAFVTEGARVMVMGRRQTAIDAALDRLGANVTAVRGDTGDLADLDRVMTEAEAQFGRIDILVANAGVNTLAPIGAVDEDVYDRLFRTNVKGVFFSVQKALPLLRNGASVILTGSIAGVKGADGQSTYAGTKAAVRAFARNWAMDLRHRGIRVNVLSPGPIRTPMVGSLGLEPDQLISLDTAIAAAVPMGRWGRAEEIAKAALFLASEESSFMTGSELSVDGGMAQV